ncbi:MAG: DnaD domain protein [Erysipelotrichia bacterium]|nr:DnaD domain protein [Erysipelotrichia bacterium]
MKYYQETYFNRRNWLLENIQRLNLNSEEAIVVLMIDFLNEFQQKVTIPALSKKCNLSNEVIDETIASLNNKGFININTKNGVYFDISNIFETTNSMIDENNLFEVFEKEFHRVISRKETDMIAEWIRMYDYEKIIKALREAVLNEKMSFKYIGTILAHSDDNE